MEKLHVALIFTLLGVTGIFLLFGIYLNDNELLKPTVMIQLISSWVTSLILIVTLSLRMITDALKRYETFAKPRIDHDLKDQLRSIEEDVKHFLFQPHHLPPKIQKLDKAESSLRMNGRFILTKLYPEDALNKIKKVSIDIDRYIKNLNKLSSEWGQKEGSGRFVQVLIINERYDELRSSYSNKAKVLVNRIKTEKIELINDTKI